MRAVLFGVPAAATQQVKFDFAFSAFVA